jgi:hypothetical protein
MAEYVAPRWNDTRFICAHCGALASHTWYSLSASPPDGDYDFPVPNLTYATCYACGEDSIWYQQRMVYPHGNTAAPPHPDLPDEMKEDYLEARAIVARSPRGAAALLRLPIQKLCGELGESGTNINDDIKGLVKKGLDVQVQQALDSVRVIGNEAVHPGIIDLRDDPELSNALFMLVNEIVDEMVAKPKRIAAVYQKLPEDKLKAIAQRDSQATQ